MTDKPETTPQEEELIRNIVKVAFGGEFIKLQEDVINLGNHVLKLQKRVEEQNRTIDGLIGFTNRVSRK